ncbi:MAG: DUF2189 domain-containing protein, partial [Pseudomonadota bacterium]
MSDQAMSASAAVGDAGIESIRVRDVPFDAPWDWLGAGWSDMWSKPHVSLSYGAAAAGMAMLIMFGLSQLGWESMILVLGGGFLIVAPFIAVGLYDVSRRLEVGEPVSLAAAIKASFKAEGQLLFMGLILLFIYLVWVRVALLLFALFLGTLSFPPPSEFIPTLLFEPHGLGLLVVGTVVGGIFAALVFVISVVAIPMLLVQDVSTVVAVTKSIEAVTRNPKPMALWAVLIAGFMVLGIAT